MLIVQCAEILIMELPKDFNPDFDGLRGALEEEPSVSIRRNCGKSRPFGPDADTVPWCPEGIYLDCRPQFTFDPCLHQGRYYVQDASSMIYSSIVRSLTADGCGPMVYLDACAAPGGKTTAAIDSLPAGSLVVANEYVPLRAQTLKENLVKWGYAGVVVSRGDTRRFKDLPAMFDIVAADVPCSGEGMFRKDPEAVRQWSHSLVEECAARQRVIVDNLWDSLKPGGYMIYSTCTFNRRENEDMLRWILDNYDASAVDLELPAEWGIVGREGCLHFLPGRIRGEGLTVAVVRKGGAGQSWHFSAKSVKESSADRKLADICRGWLKNGDDYVVESSGTSIRALPRRWMPQIKELEKRLDVIYAGVDAALLKGRDLVPSHPLAMSTAVAPEAFICQEVDYPTVISYLRREAVVLPQSAPRGFVMLTYMGAPLGFVKNLGNRANNMYPNEWRILSTHVPTEPVRLF